MAKRKRRPALAKSLLYHYRDGISVSKLATLFSMSKIGVRKAIARAEQEEYAQEQNQ